MKVFAIETSCDETATAIVDIPTRRVLASHVYSQFTEHAAYGGVIPEIASRAHLERLPTLARATLEQSGLSWNGIDAIAATTGPGLTTALAVGATFAKVLAVAHNKPFFSTNHIEGHALSPLLALPEDHAPTSASGLPPHTFPYILMLLTGGHTQIIRVDAPGAYTTLGTTKDDAVGEGFDKVGKMLGLSQPMGPAVDALAATGEPTIPFPQPLNDASLAMSFSGLKTAVREYIQHNPQTPSATIAASFQTTVASILAKKLKNALQQTGIRQAVVAGGVAANKAIRKALQDTCTAHGATFLAPPLHLCTDNAVMIAYAAGLRALHGLPNGDLQTPVTPRWPLDTPPQS